MKKIRDWIGSLRRTISMSLLKYEFHIFHHLMFDPPGLEQALSDLENRIMSALSDKIKAASDAADAAITRVQGDVSSLQTKIDALQQQVDQGTASPADEQALDDLKAKMDALDPTKPDVLPPDTGGGGTPPDTGGPTSPPNPPDTGGGTPPDAGTGTPPDAGSGPRFRR